MQHEITQAIPLLDEQGELTQPGWARRLLPVYDRSRVRGGPLRLKERDCYLVMNRQCALAITISDNRYMGMDSISLIDLWEGWQVTRSPMRLMPLGGTGLPQSSLRGSCARAGRGYGLLFQHEGEGRTLHAHMDRFRDGQALDAQILLTQEPEESIVMCTPFEKPGQFYFNQKINCMRAQGKVTLGDREYVFDPGGLIRGAGLGQRGVDLPRHLVLGLRLRHGGRGPIRLQHRIRLRGHLRRHGERPVLWRETPQALPGDLPYPTEERTGALPGPLDLRQRRPALSDEVPPHPGPGGLPQCRRGAVRPAPGIRQLHRHRGAGRRHAVRLKELLGFAEKVDDRW